MDGWDSEINMNFISSCMVGESHDIEEVGFYSSINDESSDNDQEENEESSKFLSVFWTIQSNIFLKTHTLLTMP